LSETDPIAFPLAARGGWHAPEPPARRQRYEPRHVAFDRAELNQILSLYGRQVAAGRWRDYAIDMLCDRAVFSIFRRTSEAPFYRIEKRPKLARRQGAFMVIAATGLIVRRGHDLKQVLRAIDREPRLAAVG